MVAARLATLGALLAATAQATSHASGATVQVNSRTKYQKYDGTGISEAFQRSLVMHELGGPSQKLALDYLFTTKGAGMTILRNGLGSSPNDGWDLMKSIAPEAPASNSSRLKYIPLPRDDQYQVWLSYQAKARGVHTFYADSWSADGYMKTTGTDNNGGYLCGVTNGTCETGDWRQAYANKIVQYLKDYKARGIEYDYVNPYNEPDLNTSYASMLSNGQQSADFLKVLYPTLKRSGLKTKIACCDATGWDIQQEILTGIQEAREEDTLGLVTGHGYSSKPTYPLGTDLKVWQTEWSTFDPINYDWYVAGNSSEGLTWANNIQKAFTLANVTGHIYWWGAANTTDNQSLLFVNNTSEVRVTKRLWAHAHFGKQFVRKGASRIDVGVTGSNALNVSAFANTDGSTAVQVINNGNETETVTLQGLKLAGRRKVVTYLTNQENDLTRGVAAIKQGGKAAVAKVPAKSLLSFLV